MLMTQTIVNVICRHGDSLEYDRPSAELDTEHMETATEDDDGLGSIRGAANGIFLFAIGSLAITFVGMLIAWIAKQGR